MDKEIFAVLSSLDELTYEIRLALDSLTVYSDCLDEGLEAYDKQEVWTAILFCDRFPMIESVFHLARGKLWDCLREMNEQIEKGMAEYRAGKEAEQKSPNE